VIEEVLSPPKDTFDPNSEVVSSGKNEKNESKDNLEIFKSISFSKKAA
jgi:hypothetical protein